MLENSADYFGFMAASCVIISTIAPSIRWIRFAALFSNLFFITYALMADLPPVLALHSTLLPINLWHVARDILSRFFATAPACMAPFRKRA